MKLALAILFAAINANAATWYVRPGVFSGQDGSGNPIPQAGIYGAQDGTSYTDAFNGFRSVQDSGSLSSGDTLYVCGTHIYSFTDTGNITAQYSTSIPSGTTVRGDYPGDPAIMLAGACDKTLVWTGPDANGVYSSPGRLLNGDYYPLMFQVTGTNIIRLNRKTTTTWIGDLGSASLVTGTNYVKTTTGDAPATNLFMGQFGARIWILGITNVVFESLTILGNQSFVSDSAYATFHNCRFSQNHYFNLYKGQDNWTFSGCEFSYMPNGIYALLAGQNSSANNVTVTNCYFHDIETLNDPDADGHAIGVQGASNWLITRNQIERTGAAIEFWTSDKPMTNNVVCYNWIKDVHVCSNTAGEGIGVSGDNTLSVPGLRTGIEIYGNVITTTGLLDPAQGYGILSNNRDPMNVYNNTIYHCNGGISLVGGNGSNPVSGNVKNNIIVSCTNLYALAAVGSTNTVNYDYNLLYDGTNVVFTPSVTHDVHSIIADPKFANVALGTAQGFKLLSGSPAIGAGTSAGLSTDFNGVPWRNPPSMGAFEFQGSTLRNARLKNAILR